MSASISDTAPSEPEITDYDRSHLKTYVRLLDAAEEGASWEEAASLLLGADPGRDRDRARVRYETHLARARWLRDGRYKDLLRGP